MNLEDKNPLTERRNSLPERIKLNIRTDEQNFLEDQPIDKEISGRSTSFSAYTNAPRQVLTKSEYNINIIQYPSLTAIKEEERSELKSDESLQKITVEDPAPDGGYGWVVVFAAFCCMFIVDGNEFSFGLFFDPFVQHFHTSKSKTALIGSLLSGFCLIIGPVASALINQYGCRVVIILGSLISCVGFLVSTVVPNINVLFFTYGVMGGIGSGCIYLPAIVAVGQYFNTKRAFATGIALCGSGVGTLLFAPLLQMLLSRFNWQMVLVIISGTMFMGILFGSLLRPLKVYTQIIEETGSSSDDYLNKSKVCNSISDQHLGNHLTKPMPTIKITSSSTSLDVSNMSSYVTKTETLEDSAISLSSPCVEIKSCPVSNGHSAKEIYAEKLTQHRNGHSRAHSFSNPPSVNVVLMNPIEYSRRKSMGMMKSAQTITVNPLSKKDIFYSGSTYHLKRRSSTSLNCNNIRRGSIVSTVSIPTQQILEKVEKGIKLDEKNKKIFEFEKPELEEISRSKGRSSFRNLIKYRDIFDLKLLLQPNFAFFCFSNIVATMGFYTPFVYVIQDVRSRIKDGDAFVSAEKAALLLSWIGVTNTVGRIAFGWLTDKITDTSSKSRYKITALLINNLALLGAGITVICIPFLNSYQAIAAACIMFGLFISAYVCLRSIVLVELLGIDNLTNSFGLLNLFRGLASILGTPLTGFIYDLTGSFDITFYASGSLIILSSLLSFMIRKNNL